MSESANLGFWTPVNARRKRKGDCPPDFGESLLIWAMIIGVCCIPVLLVEWVLLLSGFWGPL